MSEYVDVRIDPTVPLNPVRQFKIKLEKIMKLLYSPTLLPTNTLAGLATEAVSLVVAA